MAEFDLFLVISGIGIVLLVVFGYKALKKRLESVPFLLAIGIFIALTGTTFAIAQYLRLIESPLSFPAMIIVCNVMLGMFLVAYFYFEALNTIKPPLKRLLFVWSFFIIVQIILLANLLPSIENNRLTYLGIGVTFIFGALIVFFGVIMMRKTLKFYDHKGIKFDMLAFLLAGIANIALVILGFSVWLGYFDLGSVQRDILIFFALGVYFIGVFVLVWNSFQNKNYIYFIPIPIHRIMIYNSAGILVYELETSVKSGDVSINKSSVLMGGALSAFSDFFKEVLGQNTQLRHIDASSSEFIFFRLPNGAGTLVFIGSGVNYFIYRSMEEFGKSIPAEVLQKIESTRSLDELKQIFDNLVEAKFPFLMFKPVRETI